MGTCMGKFTKSGAFHLKVTCLHILAQYSTFKIWLKPSGEMTYLYGNHVSKLHLARITSNTPKHQGVVVFSTSDIPLGFAVTAFSTQECRNVDASAIIAYNQSDTGEYLRDETKVI